MEKLPETEKCLFCGKELPKNRRVSYFCDKECRKKFLASTSHKRVCEVCGKTFSASPASVKWCCSVECSIKRRSQKSLEHITEEMHNFLTDFNAALAPEERIRAKQYTLLSPNGEILEVINLHNWCINCGFFGKPNAAYIQLLAVSGTVQGKRKKPRYAYKGWRILQVGEGNQGIYKKPERLCIMCGKPVEGYRKSYCSQTCRDEARRKNAREGYARRKTKAENHKGEPNET